MALTANDIDRLSDALDQCRKSPIDEDGRRLHEFIRANPHPNWWNTIQLACFHLREDVSTSVRKLVDDPRYDLEPDQGPNAQDGNDRRGRLYWARTSRGIHQNYCVQTANGHEMPRVFFCVAPNQIDDAKVDYIARLCWGFHPGWLHDPNRTANWRETLHQLGWHDVETIRGLYGNPNSLNVWRIWSLDGRQLRDYRDRPRELVLRIAKDLVDVARMSREMAGRFEQFDDGLIRPIVIAPPPPPHPPPGPGPTHGPEPGGPGGGGTGGEGPESTLDEDVASYAEDLLAKAQGFLSDAELRKVIEKYAMGKARTCFEGRGYSVKDCSSRESYDYVITKDSEELFVEVKGTQSSGHDIILTNNEVEHFRKNSDRGILFILHSVQVQRDSDPPKPSGGKEAVLFPWDVDSMGSLEPITFRYRLRK